MNDEMRQYEGQTIAGKYKLVQYLSEGGFGAVYRGAHMAYELPLREVAIKVGKRRLEDREARSIFRDAFAVVRVTEAATDPILREHFVLVHDAGRCTDGGPLDGHPYVVMELIRGGSLRSCLEAGPFPLKRASGYFDQMLDAVAFLHRGIAAPDGDVAPVIHRDIKPDNFLIVRNQDMDDVVKITDFGLAVDVDTLLGWTGFGGTLSYLPPESFSENICSPKSDVYMLGLVFHEMITGRNPFAEAGSHLTGKEDDANAEERWKELRRIHLEVRQKEDFHLLDEHEELRNHPELVGVVRAALTPDRLTRPYNDASQLRDAWREAKSGKPPSTEQPWEAARRLTNEARQNFELMNPERGMILLDKALDICRKDVPNHMLPGSTYLLAAQQLLKQNKTGEALAMANEGYKRRRCRSTGRGHGERRAQRQSGARGHVQEGKP